MTITCHHHLPALSTTNHQHYLVTIPTALHCLVSSFRAERLTWLFIWLYLPLFAILGMGKWSLMNHWGFPLTVPGKDSKLRECRELVENSAIWWLFKIKPPEACFRSSGRWSNHNTLHSFNVMCTNKSLTCLCLICSLNKFIFPLKCDNKI